MQSSDKSYAILAPAGSSEQLVAAVNNGCDAVYLGLDSFNARMKAPNFNAENLRHWVDFCHFFGVKVYVTVNTSLKNSEFDSAVRALDTAYMCFADGVIVTDLALLRYAASLPKPFEVVASTQLNVHDGFGANFLKQLGASTVVCARESSFAEISEIAATGVGVESFLHGALCVCQSGQCLFSSLVGGNSGNRGLCAQPCRKLYKSNVGRYANGGYLLSAGDISGLESAKRLLDIGVTTFKIEGRNRRAEYAGATSRVYSKLFGGDFAYSDKDFNLLCEMFNRGNLPSCRYLSGRNDEIVFPQAQNHIGVVVGRVQSRKIVSELYLTKGDGLKIFDGEREVCGGVVTQSGSGVVSAEFSGIVNDGMIVRRTSSQELNKDILSAKRARQAALTFAAKAGQKASLTLTSNDVTVTVESDSLTQKAVQRPTTEEEIRQQLSKTGDLQYTISDIVLKIEDIFIAKSQINALRRAGLEKLTSAIIAAYDKQFESRETHKYQKCDVKTTKTANSLAIICYNDEQLIQAKLSADYLIFKPSELNEQTLAATNKAFCFVDLPSFSDNAYIAKLVAMANCGVVCHNVGQVQMARERNIPYIAGTGLNIFNDEMARVFDDAVTFFYSLELTLDEIARFDNQAGLIFVDGKLPLMKLVHCPYKVVFGGGCEKCQAHKKLVYTDELNNSFEIVRRKDARCSFELLNGKKLSVVGKLKKGGRYCVDYQQNTVDHYAKLNKGIVDNYTEKQPYTKGRLFNKIN